MNLTDPFTSWRTRPLPEYHKPPVKHCGCGRPISKHNLPDGLCQRCKEELHGSAEIDPLWLALVENAPDDRIELVGDLLAGRKVSGVWS